MILIRKTNINLEEMMKESGKFTSLDISSNKMVNLFKDLLPMQQLYNSAIREITTRLEILDDEFQVLYSHNPIHYIECRLKSIKSIVEKLEKRGFRLISNLRQRTLRILPECVWFAIILTMFIRLRSYFQSRLTSLRLATI